MIKMSEYPDKILGFWGPLEQENSVSDLLAHRSLCREFSWLASNSLDLLSSLVFISRSA